MQEKRTYSETDIQNKRKACLTRAFTNPDLYIQLKKEEENSIEKK